MDCLIDGTRSRAPAARQADVGRDARGLTTGTRAADALSHLEAALQAMLSYFGDPLQVLDQAIAADPSWGHPHVLKADVLLTLGEYAAARDAREILTAAAALDEGATARERAHLAAARSAAEGDWDRACELWDAILVCWPHDIAALLMAHLFDFNRGDALNLKRRPQRVLPQWSSQQPFYGYVLGMGAFGLEESGHHEEAEDAGRAALEVNRRDPWAIHAVAHVFEMKGRHQEGARWLAGRQQDWSVDNGFAYHNWFHVALFQLERMDTEAALATFDAQLAGSTGIALQRLDGTAVLWRLKLLGVDVADRFAQLRERWEYTTPAAGFYAFNDLHALVASIGAGNVPTAAAGREAMLAALAEPISGGPSNRRMSARIGLPLARAFLDYAEARFADAAEGLLKVRDAAHGFGGSHAQRDLLTLTLIDAAARAGQSRLASHVLNERCPAKAATPLTMYWRARTAGSTSPA